jgi:transposase InsO family protein
MGLARYVVEAVVLEGRSPRGVARAHGISRSWIYELLARFRAGGYEALEPRSRRPHSSPHQTPAEVVREIVRLRGELEREGHDAGAQTIAAYLAREHEAVPSVATIWRVLARQGLIAPQPRKRPRSSLIRFEASLPNELWQADITQWPLRDGREVQILNFLDDHSRLFLASQAYPTVKAPDVVEVFGAAARLHGLPAALLSDNAAVFTGYYRHGKVLLESELERLGVRFKNSRPYHPQTCGKVERLHQTLKRYLAKQPAARTLAELQRQLDTFARHHNHIRPHRALDGRTPPQAYSARIKARPQGTAPRTHFRVRHDRVDKIGRVTLRYRSRLYHIAIGRAHKGRPIKLLIADRDIRIIDQHGQLLRQLTLDPTRNYQPLRPATTVQDLPRHVSGIT